MKEKRAFYLLLIILPVLIFSGCSVLEGVAPASTATTETTGAVIPTSTPIPSAEPALGLATIESVEIQTLNTVPVEINVRVTGLLPNDCAVIDDVFARRDGDTFDVAVTTVQEPGTDCGTEEVLFEETLPLDIAGLQAGSYTVSVNGVEGTFTLEVDNVPAEETAEPTTEPEATAEPTATPVADTFSLSGQVWHDLCVGTGNAAADELPSGCISTTAGTLIADGLLEDEPGIAGVSVAIGQGSCPAAENINTTTTGDEGVFTFDNLPAGEYCLSVAADDEQNQDILLPGSWSAPAGEDGQVAITLDADTAGQEVNFGWDYDLLPVDLASCTNSFEFVDDLNIPDDTVLAPGEEFSKSWRLRNNGTCPWSTDYAVLFVGGDLMGAEEQIPLTQPVGVSQTLDVAIPMVAPLEPGTYRGNWQIADPNSEPFGIDGNIEDAFWLQIIVEEGSVPSATPLPDSGAIGGVVWDDFCINSNPGRGCIESSAIGGTFVADGAFDAVELPLPEITISLAEGACPGDGTLPTTSSVIATTLTGEDGIYLFEGLTDGTYCIFMDALSTENVDLLIPGNWTWPGTGVGQYSFILDPGEQALDLDFGWDYVD